MNTRQSSRNPSSHGDKVKKQKERELDLDLDGDGLTEREERKYGLNPLSPDSDGDGLYDGREVGRGGNPRSYSKEPPPVEPGSERERLRNAYLEKARLVLKEPALSYPDLYNWLAGKERLGRALDDAVFSGALRQGAPLEEAGNLIAQSPLVRWRLAEGEWDKSAAIEYGAAFTERSRDERERDEEIES